MILQFLKLNNNNNEFDDRGQDLFQKEREVSAFFQKGTFPTNVYTKLIGILGYLLLGLYRLTLKC